MVFDELHDHLLGKPGAAIDFPFDPCTLVFKVCGKMFALVMLDEQPMRMNLKCDPVMAQALRDRYPAIRAGYHMNKRHWNTLLLDGSLPDDLVLTLADDSYALVVRALPRTLRQSLAC
jgi:predicted DNA-binding protein (MmcQ/YjbR family)